MTFEAPTATIAFREEEDAVVGVTAVSGPDQGTVFTLGDEAMRIGSGAAAEMRLSDRAVSRLHCRLSSAGRRVRVEDLDSKNGTWVAGCRIADAEVPPGLSLQVGGTVLELAVSRRRVRRAVWTGGDAFGAVLGRSPTMHRFFAQLAKVAPADVPVLVCGESGTGKDVVARALHEQGPRRDGPLVVVDGAALSTSLADAELFGHLRGAFTGADIERAGPFERAHGGTLFLDEVGELTPAIQQKLLRVVETGQLRRVGDSQTRTVDVRVIAATCRSLDRMVNDGTFREDLLYRLRVVELRVPPLRERPEDVALLAHAFLQPLAPDAHAWHRLEQALAERAGHRWPGNVRELRSFVRRVALIGDGSLGEPPPIDDAPLHVRTDTPYKEEKRRWVDALERQYLAQLLSDTGGNLSEAARRAEIDRNYLAQLADKHGLHPRS